MIIVPKKLKLLVEEYLRRCDRAREQGGYFFGSPSKLQAFLPCPNFSKEPYNHFDRGNGDYFADLFSKLIDVPIIAEMHTHPSGTIPSEGDTKYIQAHNYSFEVIIADMKEKGFRWFVVNRQLQEVGITESDEELEKIAFMLSKEIGLMDLGRVFLTPKGELLTTDIAKKFLSLDEDAYRVYQYRQNQSRPWLITQKQMQQNLNLSPSRIKNAIKKLEEKR